MKVIEVLEGKVIPFKSKTQLKIDELKKTLVQQSEMVRKLAAELATEKREDEAKSRRSKFKVIDNEGNRNSK